VTGVQAAGGHGRLATAWSAATCRGTETMNLLVRPLHRGGGRRVGTQNQGRGMYVFSGAQEADNP
jgi:hypothetical protein